MRIAKWGNSLAVRIPKKIVNALELKEGDEISLSVQEGSPPVFEVSRTEQMEAAIEAFRKHRGLIPADYKFDRNEIYDRD